MGASSLLGSDSSDPSWIKDHKTPPTKKDKAGEATSGLKPKLAAFPVLASSSSSSSSSDDDVPLATLTKPSEPNRKRKGAPAVALDLTQDSVEDLTTPVGTQQTAEDGDPPFTQTQTSLDEEEDDPLTQTQRSLDEGPSQGGAGEATARKVVKGDARVSPAQKETILMIPEKLSKTKVLVQFDEDSDAKVDLSGDIGAVGRFLVIGKAEGGANGGNGAELTTDQVHLRMDLKGQMYNCRVLPTCTTMVMSLKDDEAKVESIATDLMRLEHDAHAQEGQHIDTSKKTGAKKLKV